MSDRAPLRLPRLSCARLPLTTAIEAVNEHGERQALAIPAERALTVYLDKRELVTLMTLGARPELLVLGYLRNQRLLRSTDEVDSISVDWEVGAAAVRTRRGVADIAQRTARRVVTTGCGQGSLFGGLLDEVAQLSLPPAQLQQAELYGIVEAIRLQQSVYKAAGSVHGCALFRGDQMLMFVEDVGRHNAIDTIAGWMWLQSEASGAGDVSEHDCSISAAPGRLQTRSQRRAQHEGGGMSGADKVFYTTGRLTSEMVIKAAQMGVPIVVSRSGITQMGHAVAQSLGLCTIGRATHRRFLCYSAPERLLLQPELAQLRPRVPAHA